MPSAPASIEITIAELNANPYPTFERIRELGSAVWVSSTRLHLVTGFEDIVCAERNHEVFASTNPNSLLNKVMGHSLLRKDGEEHKFERASIEPAFRASVVSKYWVPRFQEISASLLDALESENETDLFQSYAAPMASLCLIELLGFKGVAWQDIAWWSQALMDGAGNYQGDEAIACRATAASEAIDMAIDAVIEMHRKDENPSILSSMTHAKQTQSLEQIRANIKVIIGGGLNEPRDSILTTVLGLLTNPHQLDAVLADQELYANAFEEAIRWVSPIGMYVRRVAEDTVLGDTILNAEDQVGLCIGAANRDPARFENPHAFDIHRPRMRHLGFGAGPHFCAGTLTSRKMVGEVVLPMIFDRLPKLRLHPDHPPIERGWVFRGPTTLPVVWKN
ncbi:MAG: cytochrome P450 [Aestuariivita sp.]|nr:cytochrome P450 [Aestuariivita sp.]MCY4202537.1 cytochrome P450 [Aestuariivita sp.]MCY4289677.1 cytochrome P450 [Aestuariivita sp.]MCY4348074.1 cytochrome P450 [Aestuariivita sp.]